MDFDQKDGSAAEMEETARTKQYREDGATVYCVNVPDVQIKRTCYCVFPGIDLIYNDIHAEKRLVDLTGDPRNLLEINHCRDGRMLCGWGKLLSGTGRYFHPSYWKQ